LAKKEKYNPGAKITQFLVPEEAKKQADRQTDRQTREPVDDEGKKKKLKKSLNLKERESGKDRLYAPVCGVVYMRADAEPAPYHPQGSSTTKLLRRAFSSSLA
jgi:hypothetical protein